MAPPPVSGLTWPMRIGIGAVIVAALAGLAASAVLLLWLASILIPIAILAGAVGYAALRFQVWRLRTRSIRDAPALDGRAAGAGAQDWRAQNLLAGMSVGVPPCDDRHTPADRA